VEYQPASDSTPVKLRRYEGSVNAREREQRCYIKHCTYGDSRKPVNININQTNKPA